MTKSEPGEIVLVQFPFVEIQSVKQRPVLILKTTLFQKDNSLHTVSMITSQVNGMKIEGDYRIQNWQEAGLLHPSIIRLSKVATVDGILIKKSLGKLSKADMDILKKLFSGLFAFWL